MSPLQLGVQLFSLREELNKDFAGTLRRVAAIGYKAVELYSYDNYWGLSARELRSLLSETGLQPVSCHLDPNLLETDPDAAIAFAEQVGCSFAGFPFLFPEKRGGEAVYLELARTLTRCGNIARRHNMSFFYHNHDFEFADVGGRRAMDVLLAATDPALVTLELDVYWVQYVGLDPVAYIRELGSRCQLVHLKDMAAGAERRFAEVGEGVLDLDGVVRVGKEVGVQWYIVEQDQTYDRTPLEAIEVSLKNMKAKGWA
jgi:sugar phosphate isomerase/epimerase